MSTFINILIALLILGIIIVFHEFGHYIFARINGVTVNEFFVGFGPTLISKQIGKTKYSLKLLPLGGACVMKGAAGEVESDEEDSFASKSVWRRISIILAGPVFNFILAFIASLFIVGFIGTDKCEIIELNSEAPIASSGIMPGDIITEINGKNIDLGRDLYNYTYFNELTSKPFKLTVKRNGKELKFKVDPLATTQYYMGVSYTMDDEPVEVQITDDLPAGKAGIKTGDIITSVNGHKVKSGKEFGEYLAKNPLSDSEIKVTYTHNDKEHETSFVPEYRTMYSLGFSYNIGREKTDALGVLKYSLVETRYWITSTIDSLKYMITGHFHKEDIGGPIRVVNIISDSIEETKEEGVGITILQLLIWVVLISANLGVMNLLPIPALDGGHLLLYIIEIIRGKPLSKEKEAIIQIIGFLLVLALFVFVIFNDIVNVFF